MNATVRLVFPGTVPALVVSLALHVALVAVPALLGVRGLWELLQPKPPQESVAMVGDSLEVEAPTPEPAAAPPPAAAERQVDVETETETEPKASVEIAAKPKAKPEPASKALLPKQPALNAATAEQQASAATATTGAAATGTFGAEGLAPGVRRLGYAFTRAIPAAAPSVGNWCEMPVGPVGTIRIELEVGEDNHLGEMHRWQLRPNEPEPPALLELMAKRVVMLLGAGQFALSGSNQAGTERLTIEVVLRDEEPEGGAECLVFKRGFPEGATPGHPGKAYFKYGTGRVFEAKVTIAPRD